MGAALQAVQGQTFSANASLQITDQRMRTRRTTAADVFTSNGAMHVVDRALPPVA